jgi:maleylpyruvate isomerase
MKLYSYWRSTCSWRVRIALAWKELPYEYQAIHLVKEEQHSERYRAINPMRTVPLLELEENDRVHRISQSLAILEFLEERFPEKPLLPKDLFERARARQIAEMVNSGIQPLQNLSTTNQVKAIGGDPAEWTRGFVSAGLAAFARTAAETAGAFCVGDAPTIADCCLVPQLASARRFGADIAPLGQLLEIEARCLALPAFANAVPDQQPDAVRS